jgi:4-aminobutyrate aminotransferase/(S)-3-amino-2-methylpropionate transaminase
MLQLDCSDLILSYAWIDNKKTGSSGGQSFTVVNPDLIVTATSLGIASGGITGRAEIMDAPGPGGLGGRSG